MTRDVEQDPRVGDVVQWHPGITSDPLPAPLTITEVSEDRVYWVRNGEHRSTSRAFWRGERKRGAARGRLSLIEQAA